jgi:hypothetical protein
MRMRLVHARDRVTAWTRKADSRTADCFTFTSLSVIRTERVLVEYEIGLVIMEEFLVPNI